MQHVNKRLLALGRDDTLWREQCFIESPFLENLRRRRELLSADAEHDPRFRDLALALANGNGLGESRLTKPREEARDLKARSNEKIRIMANWDPSYPSEKVRWYDEYIARNAPISTSWLQQPRNRESTQHEYLEIRGMGLYTETGESDSSLVVAPLDDGSVCVWDIAGTLGRKGSIIARSNSGILFPPEGIHTTAPKDMSKMISPGVTECISIDNSRKRAYFAVQEGRTPYLSFPKLQTHPSNDSPLHSRSLRIHHAVKPSWQFEVTHRSLYMHVYNYSVTRPYSGINR